MEILELLGRSRPLFVSDIANWDNHMCKELRKARCLVIGAAGSIGQSVVRELFKRHPSALHVIDINENNLVELVRDVRSTLGYSDGDFRTFAIDAGSSEFTSMLGCEGPYNYVFNLSALKHVRSEKDPYTLMRMIQVNIINSVLVARAARSMGSSKYFSVSTDKAANPVNMMGASKRIMELFLLRESQYLPVSMARFANVAFSDGSLLHGFRQRILKRQPISAPRDIRRYFVTEQEAGELCLLSALLAENKEIFFPKLDENHDLIKFSDIARRYLEGLGYEIYECATEDEARSLCRELIPKMIWPCYFFDSDTTGEKNVEEFFMQDESVNLSRFNDVGIVQCSRDFDEELLLEFEENVDFLRRKGSWSKQDLVKCFYNLLPHFEHLETGKYLDGRM